MTFLGVGSAFAKRNFQSNALVEAWATTPDRQGAPDDTLLIDFGATGPLALYQLRAVPGFEYLGSQGTEYGAIRKVFVTHLHNDHVGGLEELAICTKFGDGSRQTGPNKPMLIGTAELVRELWDGSLRGGLGAGDGRAAGLEDYFQVHALRPMSGGWTESFALADRYEVRPFATDHIRIALPFDWPSFGAVLADRTSGETVLFSGDTRFDPRRIVPLMESAKLSFHEVQLEPSASLVHTLLSELRELPAKTRKKTLLYHFSDDWDSVEFRSVANEFAGFAQPLRRYVLFL